VQLSFELCQLCTVLSQFKLLLLHDYCTTSTSHPYFMSSNSPSGGIKLIARSVSNLLSFTHCKKKNAKQPQERRQLTLCSGTNYYWDTNINLKIYDNNNHNNNNLYLPRISTDKSTAFVSLFCCKCWKGKSKYTTEHLDLACCVWYLWILISFIFLWVSF